MISEVDLALRTLIEREVVDAAEVDVAFDAPTKDWAARRNAPTIDVYLYDIREDLRRRQRGLLNEYEGQRITARHLPPRYFKLSYLVAAWTQRPEDEHRLLSDLLGCFLRHDALPLDVLTGSLQELELPVPVTVALPPPEDRSFADVWTALGGELKPSLDVVVCAPTATGQVFRAAPAVRRTPSLVAGAVRGARGVDASDAPPWTAAESRRLPDPEDQTAAEAVPEPARRRAGTASKAKAPAVKAGVTIKRTRKARPR